MDLLNIHHCIDLLDGFGQLSSDTFILSERERTTRSTSKYRIPYSCNIFEKYDSLEPFTSWALSMIFKFNMNGDYILFKSFAARFLKSIGFNLNNIHSPKIIAESEDRIDVLIKEDNYCVIIENKLKGALFQRNQLARYIKSQEKYPKDKVFIVLLPKDCSSVERYAESLSKSVWNLPEDYKDSNGSRKCSVDQNRCWCDLPDSAMTEERLGHCKKCISYIESGYISRTVTIHSGLSGWLIDDCLPLISNEETILKSFIVQFADFLKLQYNTRESEQLINEMKEFLRKQLNLASTNGADENLSLIEDKIKDLQYLLEDLKNLRSDEYGKQINEWYAILKKNPDFSDKLKTDGKSFGILIENIWCGCWYKDNVDSHPYWGFYKKDSLPDENDITMVSAILDNCEMAGQGKQENRFIRWANTDDGVQVCERFYYSAIKLGYLR